MILVDCGPDTSRLMGSNAERRVALYGHPDHAAGIGAIGSRVRGHLARMRQPIPIVAFDFLSIALAVTAADEFVTRDDGAYGFARDLTLRVSLAKPEVWQSVQPQLESTLRFLSGDNWTLDLRAGGLTPPTRRENRRLRNKFDFTDTKKVCLFSGGLDSLIGAIDCLNETDRKTILVSRASSKDRMFQNYLLGRLGDPPHFGVNDVPARPLAIDRLSTWPKEDSTRTRSILFIALGVCLAAAVANADSVSSIPLLIPENGVIALNAPLTSRRRGALSTRTAHPHYIASLQSLLHAVNIPVSLDNPYKFKTKGEMLRDCEDQTLIRKLAQHTVSCSRWKREDQQCGHCVPCLIRLASLHSAGLSEPVGKYQFEDLQQVLRIKKRKADLASVMFAIRVYSGDKLARWVSQSGDLPRDDRIRKKYYGVAGRGLAELQVFLNSKGIVI